jgi:hypothetical protein
MRRGMRLGFSDAGHRNYINHAIDDLAKSPYIRAKERDKRRYLNSRFCLTEEADFTVKLPILYFHNNKLTYQWPDQKGASPFGSEEEVLKCLVVGFSRFINRIPDALMHRLWILDNVKARFIQRLHNCSDIHTLRYLMLLFERVIRKPAFLRFISRDIAYTEKSF